MPAPLSMATARPLNAPSRVRCAVRSMLTAQSPSSTSAARSSGSWGSSGTLVEGGAGANYQRGFGRPRPSVREELKRPIVDRPSRRPASEPCSWWPYLHGRGAPLLTHLAELAWTNAVHGRKAGDESLRCEGRGGEGPDVSINPELLLAL